MCSFSFSTDPKNIILFKRNNTFLEKRGPDNTSYIQADTYCAAHNLLHITGSKTVQPLEKDNLVILFNGEIYNYPRTFKNDTLSIPTFYKNIHNIHSVLDGEYAMLIYDKSIGAVYFFKDIFGTKPLYYSTDGSKLLVSSLRSGLLGVTGNAKSVLPNTLYRYDIKSRALTIKKDVHKFCTQQKKGNLQSFNKALTKAINKRIPSQKFCIGVSSGIDSGILALHTYKSKFANYISILNNENKQVCIDRATFLRKKLFFYTFDTFSKAVALKKLITNSEPKPYLDYDYFQDSSSCCLSYIGRYCNERGVKIFLSGTGGDEIYSDYGFNGEKFTNNSCFGGLYPDDLSTVFPWKNFYGGTMQKYLEKDEKILGSFGIETRYPFLDKELVQEFLWLTSNIKNKEYKFCLTSNLKKYNFPYWLEKKGFSCEKK